MSVKEILLLGNPTLYQCSAEVSKEEVCNLGPLVKDLHDTLMNYKKHYCAGRAIAAPQIGIQKRVIYVNIDKPVVMINPVMSFPSDDTAELWDDCMSFPGLIVKVKRYKKCKICFKDMLWKDHESVVNGDLAELLQHEYDHLDGILAVDRAIDKRSFAIQKDKYGIAK